MKQIRTTATAVEKIRNCAKELAKRSEMTHQQALELASKQSGYESWFHVRLCQKHSPASEQAKEDNPSARQDNRFRLARSPQEYMDYLAVIADGVSIERFPPRRGLGFHSVEIDGHSFSALAGTDGPYVSRQSRRKRGFCQGQVQLGVAEIFFTRPPMNWSNVIQEAWFVCKYDPSQPRVFLGDLDPPIIHAVAHQFGIPIHYGDQAEARPPIESYKCWMADGAELFYLSPAFQSLCDVAKNHPRKVRGWGTSPYVGAWSEAALAGKYISKRWVDCDAEKPLNQ